MDVVLCNSNPATIMTDQAMADEIYLEPLTTETIKRIIKKEKPDSLLAGLGGQTGLTLAMQLDKEGFLEEQGVRLLGTDAKAISRAEDRELFKEAMAEIGAVVEGYYAAESIHQLAEREQVEMPICRSIYEVLYHGMAVQDVVSNLMRRAKKDELTETTWL